MYTCGDCCYINKYPDNPPARFVQGKHGICECPAHPKHIEHLESTRCAWWQLDDCPHPCDGCEAVLERGDNCPLGQSDDTR